MLSATQTSGLRSGPHRNGARGLVRRAEQCRTNSAEGDSRSVRGGFTVGSRRLVWSTGTLTIICTTGAGSTHRYTGQITSLRVDRCPLPHQSRSGVPSRRIVNTHFSRSARAYPTLHRQSDRRLSGPGIQRQAPGLVAGGHFRDRDLGTLMYRDVVRCDMDSYLRGPIGDCGRGRHRGRMRHGIGMRARLTLSRSQCRLGAVSSQEATPSSRRHGQRL